MPFSSLIPLEWYPFFSSFLSGFSCLTLYGDCSVPRSSSDRPFPCLVVVDDLRRPTILLYNACFFYDDCINFFRFSHLVLLLGPPPCFMHTVINHDVTRARVFFPLSFFLSFFWPRDWRKYDCGAQFYDECIVSYHIRGSSAATSRFPRSLSKLRSSIVYNNEDHEQRGNKKQLIIKLLHWHILL